MAYEQDRVVTIGGIEFKVLKGLSDETLMVPYDPIKQKKVFPVDGELHRSFLTASRGISSHVLDLCPILDDEVMGLPKPFSKEGFAAKHLNLLGDDKFYPECWDVLMSNGWADNFGELACSLVEGVCHHDGVEILEKSKEVFGDAWYCYIAERASIHLSEPFTRVWYAANLLSAYYARQDDLLFGYLWSEYNLKMRAEKNAETGSKVIAGTRLAAEQTNATNEDLRNERFKLMQKLIPEIGTD